MSVLGTIAKRLQTDIADIARATIDPQFSRELDRRESTRQQFDRERAAALEDRETLRQQRLEDEDRLLSNRLQMAAITETFTRASNTNDWRAWAGLISGMEDNQNVNEAIKRYAFDLNNNQGTKSIDRLKLENQWAKDYAQLSLQEKRLALEVSRYESSQQQWVAEQLLKEQEFEFEKMLDLRDQAEKQNNKAALMQWVKETPIIATQKERTALFNQLREASPDQVIRVWDEATDRYSQRIDNMERAHRSRVQANAIRAAQNVSPTRFDLDFASDVLEEALGDEWGNIEADSREKMIRFVADQTKNLARQERTASSNKVLQAVADARAGLQDRGGLWKWVPLAADQEFSVGGALQGGGQIFTPQTQGDYDALPSGARYIDPEDGKEYTKP